MIRTGYFDAAGKCLVIHSGAGDPPQIDYAYSKEVPHGLGPGHVEFNGRGKLRKVVPEHEREHPVDSSPTLLERVAELEARVRQLEG